jgi:D-serine deaminase-like pyridoxal phosphate-dependent protein
MQISSLPTPQVLIERSRLMANLDRMQAAATARGLALRPHAKTHKSIAVARWQVERGAVGIYCAKLGEAEVFAAAGLEDIRLPYPLQPANAGRVLALLDRTRLSFIVDHAEVARGWSDAMRRAGRTVDILIKVDVGFHRCGIDPDDPGAMSCIREVAQLPGLRLRGLLSHAGHGYAASSEDELAAIARREAEILTSLARTAAAEDIELPEISVGATPTVRFSLRETGPTELRPGNYAYYDRTQVGLGAAHLDDCALTVMATVVSRPARDRLILDCGSKTLSSDAARGFGGAAGYGRVYADLEGDAPDDDLVVERLSEEHATVRVRGSAGSPLKPGDRVRVLPNHSCVVSNLVDVVRLVDRLQVLETMSVDARGRVA